MAENQKQELFTFDDLEKFIFFNIKDKGLLKRVEGVYKSIYSQNSFLISQNNDLDSIIMAQTRDDSLQLLGKEYNNVYISYIPAKELSYLECNNNFDHQAIKNELINAYRMPIEKVISLIQTPLLKVSKITDNLKIPQNDKEENRNDFLECVISGRRSSILFSKDEFAIRLKGSGNSYNGFELGEVLNIAKNHFEIFGCQFKNTCLREQYICNKVNLELYEYNFFCGNLPIGYWKYDKTFIERLKNDKELNPDIMANLKNDAEMIDKYCGLFLTAGEKRLGYHFFRGFSFVLDTLLNSENFINQVMKIIDIKILNEAIKQRGKEDPNIKNPENINEIHFSIDETDFEVNSPDENYKNLYNLLNKILSNKESKSNEGILDNSEELLFSHLADFIRNPSGLGEKYFNESIKKKTLDLLDDIQNYLKINKIDIFTCLVLLFSQIAYECGLIKKCLEKNNLIWGTYEFHCNAHLDNFILIKKNKNCRLLSPIDFDLAYFKEEFIDIKYKDLKGIEAQVGFEDLMLREKNYLLIQLLGINPIPNIDVDIPYFRNLIEKIQSKKIDNAINMDDQMKIRYLENLENLIKENVSLYYSKGFHECKESEMFFGKHYEINYMMMELILILEALI